MGRTIAILAVLAVIAGFATVAPRSGKRGIDPAADRHPDQQVAPLSPAQLRGRPALVNFWTTWCSVCRQERPMIERLHAKYASRGLAFVGIALDSDGEAVDAYLREHPLPYPAIRITSGWRNAYPGIDAVPTTLLLDGNGKVVIRHTGYDDGDDYSKEVESLLAAGQGGSR